VSILLSLPPLIGWSEYVYTPTHSFCFADWVNHMSYAFFMIGCCFGIPFSVMTVCNICILRSVRLSRLRVKSNSKNLTSSEFSDSFFKDKSSRRDNSVVKPSTLEQDTPINADKTEDIDKQCSGNERYSMFENIHEDVSIVEICDDDNKYDFDNNNDDKQDIDTVTRLSVSMGNIDDDSNTDISSSELFRLSSNSDAGLLSPSNRSSTSPILGNRPRNNCVTWMDNGDHSPELKDSEERSSKTPPNSGKRRGVPNFNDSCGTSQHNDSLLHPNWRPTSKQVTPNAPNEQHVKSSGILTSNSNSTIDIKHISAPPPKKRGTSRSAPLRRREELRLAISLSVVVIVFVICWLPYCISMILSIFYTGKVPREFHMFTLLIGYANSCCNPIIYGVMNKRFKVGFEQLFCFWRHKRDSSISSA